MNLKTKVIIFIIVLILTMLVLPLLVFNFAEPHEAMGWTIIMFLAINPITSIVLGVIAGSDIRKVWCIPLVIAIAFPLLFWIVLRTVILELFIYSSIYILPGLVAMCVTKLIKKKDK